MTKAKQSSIIAKNSGGDYELLKAGLHFARCIKMVHLGTIDDIYGGVSTKPNKVMLFFELPNMTKEFKEGEGEKPFQTHKEFTLSMNEKANLRKMLVSWRGQDFTDEEAEEFDITAVLGAPCMLNIIHKKSAKGKDYDDISAISPLADGTECPEQFNESVVVGYNPFDEDLFYALPDWIKKKMRTSEEFKAMDFEETAPENENFDEAIEQETAEDAKAVAKKKKPAKKLPF